MEDIIKQINKLYGSAKSINFVTTFSANELDGCATLEEALPKVKELYAPTKDPRYPQDIQYVQSASLEKFWEEIERTFTERGEYEKSQGILFSEDEEDRLKSLQKDYQKMVESYLRTDTAIYSFVSSRTTFDLFGFMILNKDGNSLAILAENSD